MLHPFHIKLSFRARHYFRHRLLYKADVPTSAIQFLKPLIHFNLLNSDISLQTRPPNTIP